MARIWKLDEADALAVDPIAGFLVDAEGQPQGQFLPVAAAALVTLRQPVPVVEEYPSGSIGQLLQASANGMDQWYVINDFSHDAADIVEQGNIVADVMLSWSLGFSQYEALGYTLEGPGTPVEIEVDATSVTLLGVNIGATATWTLTCLTAFQEVIATCTLDFGFKVFWGRGDSTLLTEAQIEALAGNTLATEQQLNYVFAANVAGAGSEYLWLAYPDEFGTIPTFLDTATSLKVPFTDMGVVVVTNSLSVVRNYRLARSVSGVNGAISLVTSDVIVEGEATVAYVEAAVAAKQDKVLAAGWAGVGSAVTPLIGGTVSASIPFTPFQVIWLLELACSAAGPATVTLTGMRRDNVTSETVAVYNLSAGQTIYEANDRTDYVKFVWTSTGSGTVTARTL